MKQCSRCGEWKEEWELRRGRLRCKKCMAAYYSAYHIAHKNEIAKRQATYRGKYKEKILVYKATHKKEILDYAKKYYTEHKEKIAKRKSDLYKKRKENGTLP